MPLIKATVSDTFTLFLKQLLNTIETRVHKTGGETKVSQMLVSWWSMILVSRK